jgi:hypothetical protein
VVRIGVTFEFGTGTGGEFGDVMDVGDGGVSEGAGGEEGGEGCFSCGWMAGDY